MKFRLLVIAIGSGLFARAQQADTSYWQLGGAASTTFTQVSLTNWASGGDNSVSLNGYFNVFGDYEKDKISWSNDLELGYGVIKQGEGESRKTDDIIQASTQFGYKISKKTYWSSLLDFRTQFNEGLDSEGNRISDFMAPGYLVIATGLDWKPDPIFSMTYAPLTGKFTFVNDVQLAADGAFGVDPGVRDSTGAIIENGSSSRAELGSFLKLRLKKPGLFQNVDFNSKLELFSNYLKDFGNIDVNWQNQVVMKVNSLISVNWQTQLIYDHDIKIPEFNEAGEETGASPKTQFKSVFGVGIVYKFGATKE